MIADWFKAWFSCLRAQFPNSNSFHFSHSAFSLNFLIWFPFWREKPKSEIKNKLNWLNCGWNENGMVLVWLILIVHCSLARSSFILPSDFPLDAAPTTIFHGLPGCFILQLHYSFSCWIHSFLCSWLLLSFL